MPRNRRTGAATFPTMPPPRLIGAGAPAAQTKRSVGTTHPTIAATWPSSVRNTTSHPGIDAPAPLCAGSTRTPTLGSLCKKLGRRSHEEAVWARPAHCWHCHCWQLLAPLLALPSRILWHTARLWKAIAWLRQAPFLAKPFEGSSPMNLQCPCLAISWQCLRKARLRTGYTATHTCSSFLFQR